MLKRPLFWLGLLFGALLALGSRVGKPPKTPAEAPEAAWDLSGDAVLVWNRFGEVIHSSEAARTLFGPRAEGLSRLCYPNGQTVPPGQLPQSRVRLAGPETTEAEYRTVRSDGAVCVLEVRARGLPDGGAAAAFRDVTARHEVCRREDQVRTRKQATTALSRRLAKASSAEEIARASVESVRMLLEELPETQIRLYRYSAENQALTRLASDPEDRPKRPKSAALALSPAFPFDAQVPALWQLYVARHPSADRGASLDGTDTVSAYALPLLASGAALGHLSLVSSFPYALDDPDLRETLAILASLTAFALSGPAKEEAISALEANAGALREMAQAVADGRGSEALADLLTGTVRRIMQSQVCTLSVLREGKLTLIGSAVQDDLLFPGRIALSDPALQGKTVQKAYKTQKVVSQVGIVNPGAETGPWRAFAGRAGLHSVCAVPMTQKLGVLAIYRDGSLPLPDAQIKFLETVAALVSVGLNRATASEAAADG